MKTEGGRSGGAGRVGGKGAVRLFAHTADIGLDVRGETLEDLFTWAAIGFARVTVGSRAAAAGRRAAAGARRRGEQAAAPRRVPVDLPPAPDIEALLVDWLNFLIYTLETARLFPVGCDIRISGGDEDDAERGAWALHGSVEGAPVPPHGAGTTVKAATYHDLKVERLGGSYRARVILDI